LIWTRDQRDDWRPTYIFRTPLRFAKGSRLEAIVHLRNRIEDRPGAGAIAEPISPDEPILTLFYTAATARPAHAPGS
jgi:hypothetical protein